MEKLNNEKQNKSELEVRPIYLFWAGESGRFNYQMGGLGRGLKIWVVLSGIEDCLPHSERECYQRNQVVSQEEVAELRGEVGELQTQLLRHQVAPQHIVHRGRGEA